MRVAHRKATFNLPESLLTELNDVVASGLAESKNALVERALIATLKDVRRQARNARWQVAARDQLFLKDIAEVEAAFASADAETVRQII